MRSLVAMLAHPWATAAVAGLALALLVLVRRRHAPFGIGRRGAMALCAAAGAMSAWLSVHGCDWRFWCDAFSFTLRLGSPRLGLMSLGVFALCLWRARKLPTTLSSARRRAMWAFGSGAAVAAALAVASPEWGHPIDRLTVVLAVDRSRSMELVASAAVRARDEEARAVESMHDEDRIARVVFGTEAATEDPAHPRSALASAQEVLVGADGTDLGAAIRRALAEVPDESAGRIVVITDGASNRGDPLGAAAAASAAGIPVDVLRLSHEDRPNIRLESVRLPLTADEGEAFDLRVVTRSATGADVQVRVSVDGRVVQTGHAHIGAGEDVLTLRQRAPAAGLRRYEVDVATSDSRLDAVVQDNRAGGFLRVRGPSRVLILEGERGRSAPLAQALSAAAFRVDERGATGFPDDLAALAAYDLVVLSDVPARELSPDQMEQLATYVRELGGGLLLMGGDRSMGPGGYARTPVEEISPLAFDMRQERRRASLAEIIAIDFSGSMAMRVSSGQTKLQLANEAAARSAALLGPGDSLGVMHVDTQVHWTVPLAPIRDESNLRDVTTRIRAVGPSGGGIIIPVTLEESYRALRTYRANLRHLLLFADGDDSEMIEGQAALVAEAYTQGITTSVVSLGRGHDTPELENLSRAGHGRFYLVEDAMRLPAVFAQETILAARSSIREEPFRPRVVAPDVVTRGIDFAAGPPLRGWVVTIPKARASVLLSGPDNDPILATWQVGVGRVAAFTSDAKDRWGRDWIHWPEAQRLWAELARSLVRRTDPFVRVDADTRGGVLHVHADARTPEGYADSLRRLTARINGPDGRVRELALDPVGAGTYAAEIPLERPGAYAIAIRDDQHGGVVANGGAMLLEGEELRPPSDAQLVERIVAMTGGRMRTSLAEIFRDRMGLRRAFTPLSPFLLWAAAAMMFASLLARRLAMPEVLANALEARRARAREAKRRRQSPASAASTTVTTLLARKHRTVESPPSPDSLAPRGASPTDQQLPSPAAGSAKHFALSGPVGGAPATLGQPSSPAQSSASGTGSASIDALLAKKRARK